MQFNLTCPFDELLIFLRLTLVDIFCLKFDFPLYHPKEKNDEIKTKINTFSLVSDIDVETILF